MDTDKLPDTRPDAATEVDAIAVAIVARSAGIEMKGRGQSNRQIPLFRNGERKQSDGKRRCQAASLPHVRITDAMVRGGNEAVKICRLTSIGQS